MIDFLNPISLGLFTPGHFMRFFWLDSYPILKRPGVNALRNAFETDRSKPLQEMKTGQVEMHLVVETTYANFTPSQILK